MIASGANTGSGSSAKVASPRLDDRAGTIHGHADRVKAAAIDAPWRVIEDVRRPKAIENLQERHTERHARARAQDQTATLRNDLVDRRIDIGQEAPATV